ncbi:MAG: hypothetical protein IIA61_02025 [Candidatus Marinimicrobia bacterium]|nr:hypothetical protein [Candidatus Neomarinimicrobiota bacterium]
MTKDKHTSVLMLSFMLSIIFLTSDANATSQWSRKYKTPCSTCHIAFPRLNYYGERFMLNGYQDPDTEIPDGSTLAKKVFNQMLSMDKLDNHVGIRLNLTPIQVKTKALTVNNESQEEVTYAKTNWFQVFIAGTISKNVSIFIESEFADQGFHFSWFHLGFHNIGGTSLANAFVGNLSPLDFASYANRLRQIGAIKGDIFGIKTSGGAKSVADGGNGAAEDALNTSGSRPGLMYFGYKGPVVVWAGISPGESAVDPNNKIHYWVGGKLLVSEDMESKFEGSNVTAWVYKGEDATATESAQITNPYTRISLQGNLRYQGFDIQAAYLQTTEENYSLGQVSDEVKYSGISIVGGKQIGKFYPVLQFDTITYEDEVYSGKKLGKITVSMSYFLRENIRLGVHARLDQDGDGDDQRSHDIQANVRIMF